jgi:hypothetical protein
MARRRLAPSVDSLDLDPPPGWSPSTLRQVLRRPAVYWAAAALLALSSVLIVQRVTADARSLQEVYGDTTTVLVTTEEVSPGTALAPVTEPQEIPLGLVPDNALLEVEPAQQATVTLTRGSIVTLPHVTGTAALAIDEAAVAIPRGPQTPPVAAGQAILVVINADPFIGVETQVIDAWVMSSTETQVITVVRRADLAATSVALQSGVVTVALTG